MNKNKLKIGVVGSRDFSYYDFFKEKLNLIIETIKKETNFNEFILVSGGARGIDSFAQKYAKENGLSILIHYPDWEKFGKKGGFIRNEKIIDDSDFIVAFWNGISKGTEDSIKKAKKANKKVIIIDI